MDLIFQPNGKEVNISRFILLMSFLILGIFVILVVLRFSQAGTFVQLLSRAEPRWLFLALILQIGTYFCAGCIWDIVIKTAGHQVPLSALARLSVEKLSIDQLLPTGGVSGNLIVIQTIKRPGLPDWLAIEMMLADIFSHYIA